MLGFLLTALSTAPALAGSWQLAATGTMTAAASPPATQSTFTLPAPSTGSLSLPSYKVGTSVSIPKGQTASATTDMSIPVTVTITWVADPTLPADPAPTVLRFTKSSSTGWNASGVFGNFSAAGSTASDGLGDPCVNDTLSGTSSGSLPTRQLAVTGGSVSWTDTLSAHGAFTASGQSFGFGTGGFGLYATLNSYSVSIVPLTAAIKVDQDEQVFAPAPTIHFTATLSNISGFTVDGVQIIVDGGTPVTATMTPGNPNNYYIDWPSASAGNPSEHTVEAKAQIHDAIGSIPLDSTAALGNDRVADDIIADVRLQSLKFNNNILLNQDATTPVPTPEFTWNPATNALATSNPAAYIQGKNVNFTMLLGSSTGAALTGGATMGYTLKLQADPHTTGPPTGVPPVSSPDPVLTLYDNTTGTPVAPTVCTSSTTVNATPALDAWVARYTTTFPTLNFYVQFTHVTPTPVWKMIDSYGSASLGQPIYALLAAPTAPMATPWTGVLDYACDWAKRTADATSATTAVTKGLYDHGTYNKGYRAFTGDLVDGSETFMLKQYLAFSTPKLWGQCDDFSDFLVCLSNAIGARPIKTQRSSTAGLILAGGFGFQTKPITASQEQDATKAAAIPSPGWAYHQWTNDTTLFDGCIRFMGVITPADMAGPAIGSLYNIDLVASYDHPTAPTVDWNPQPPFVPTISN